MQKIIMLLFLASWFLAACIGSSVAEENPVQDATEIPTTLPIPTGPPLSPTPQPTEVFLTDRDLVRVSTSRKGNHVNTVVILQPNEWVVIAGTGGILYPNEHILGVGNNCYFLAISGPTTAEYSVELIGEDDYFLAILDHREFASGFGPGVAVAWLLDVYEEEDFGDDFCPGFEIIQLIEKQNYEESSF